MVQVPQASVPLSPNAGPMERAVALEQIRELPSTVRNGLFSWAIRWRDYLLATGQVPAVGRLDRDGQLQPIIPAEFAAGLRLAGPHAMSPSGQLSFYDVRLSGAALIASRQAALEASSPGVTDQPPNLDQFMPTGAAGRPSKGLIESAGVTESHDESASAPDDGIAKRRGPIATKGKISEAARLMIKKGLVPAKTITWERFREEICKLLKVKPETRDYSLDTIQNAVRPLIKNALRTQKIESIESTET